MGHSSKIISVDVYGDNEEIIADCLDELKPFIKLVQPNDKDEFGDELLDGIDESFIEQLKAI